jgi:hypothetical protein
MAVATKLLESIHAAAHRRRPVQSATPHHVRVGDGSVRRPRPSGPGTSKSPRLECGAASGYRTLLGRGANFSPRVDGHGGVLITDPPRRVQCISDAGRACM